jgi:hypothetical protein
MADYQTAMLDWLLAAKPVHCGRHLGPKPEATRSQPGVSASGGDRAQHELRQRHLLENAPQPITQKPSRCQQEFLVIRKRITELG